MGFDNKYDIRIPIYELKNSGEKDWYTVSEISALKKLADYFERITPIISEMLHGKEVNTQRGTIRIKNYSELIRTYQL
jgi:hypothetical protein